METSQNAGSTKHLHSGIMLALVSLLAGCDGGHTDPDQTNVQTEGNQTAVDAELNLEYPGLSVYGLGSNSADQVSTPWLSSIQLAWSDSGSDWGYGGFSGQTVQYRQRTAQDEIDFRLGQIDLDNCVIRNTSSGGGNASTGSIPYVSAGQSMTINTSAGPWLVVDATAEGRYRVGSLPGALPVDGSVSIPGDVFPSVGAYPLFKPAAPVRLDPPAGIDFELSGALRWLADESVNNHIIIDFREYDNRGEHIGTPVFCTVVDDGEFEIPIDILGKLAEIDRDSDLRVLYSRQHRRVEYSDGILYFYSASVVE